MFVFGINRIAEPCIVLHYLKNMGKPDVRPGIKWMCGTENLIQFDCR